MFMLLFAFIATGSAVGSDDIIAGNVSKYTVLPVGYCGLPKKGHLIFDACFESGKHFWYCFMLWRCQYINVFSYITHLCRKCFNSKKDLH